MVVAGTPPGALLARVIDDPPVWSKVAIGVARPLGDAPEVANIRSVRARGPGAFTDVGSATAILRSDTGVLAATAAVSGGTIVMVASASVFHNRLLARADNAAFAVAVAGSEGRPVAFVENVHGYGEAIGLGALPKRWWWALGGLAIAALALMWSRGMRLGPAELDQRELPPSRRAYVEALGASLANTKAAAGIARPLRDRAQRMGAGDRILSAEESSPDAEALRVGRVFARVIKERGGRL